jgi:hypothetical protein
MYTLSTNSSETLKSATQQIRTLLTHPYFTGQCPHCHTRLPLRSSLPKKSFCISCGWNDLPVQPGAI